MLSFISHQLRELQIKTTNRYHNIPTRIAKIKKPVNPNICIFLIYIIIYIYINLNVYTIPHIYMRNSTQIQLIYKNKNLE